MRKRQSALRETSHVSDELLRLGFESFIRRGDYPCVGAKAALAKGQIRYLFARDLGSAWDDLRLHREIVAFARRQQRSFKLFSSLVVIFRTPQALPEADFERLMWERLQSLHDKDRWLGFAYDPEVSADPASPSFSFSLGGSAFFLVGLNPGSNRRARRFRRPALVFNLHRQFEMLRGQGAYSSMRSKILSRDVAFSGSINPMLAVHGETSEARQYSGRRTSADWQCPFHARATQKVRRHG